MYMLQEFMTLNQYKRYFCMWQIASWRILVSQRAEAPDLGKSMLSQTHEIITYE